MIFNQRHLGFRVWDVKNKKWFHALFIKELDLPKFALSFGKSYIVTQFTGLKDKNGKKIFEGDLIKFKCYNSASLYYEKQYLYPIVWHEDECAFVVSDSSDGAYFNRFPDMFAIEVIGNIFENKTT